MRWHLISLHAFPMFPFIFLFMASHFQFVCLGIRRERRSQKGKGHTTDRNNKSIKRTVPHADHLGYD